MSLNENNYLRGISPGTIRAHAAANMSTRPLVLAIALYVALDLTNPFMPGAFHFDPEESVEGISTERSWKAAVTLAAPVVPRVGREHPSPASPHRRDPRARHRSVEPGPAHVRTPEPPPLSEDH
jgi:hypothetical protein